MTGPYLHGGDVYSAGNIRLDFSVNLNPLGMPREALRRAHESLDDCERYPDSRCRALRRAAAAAYGVGEDQMVFGNGAADLIYRAVQAVSPGRAVLLAPTFGEYEAALKLAGVPREYFFLKEENGFELPTEEYLEFLKNQAEGEKEGPTMIFLCNPSNPVGTVLRKNGLRKILDFCKERGVFAVVDECFLEFLEESGELSALEYVRHGRTGLFVINGLTKTFSMAGLRLGYGFSADLELAEKIAAAGQPWPVSVVAQAAGEAIFSKDFDREAYLEETRRTIREEKGFLRRGLLEAGFQVYGSAANFLFFRDRPERAKNGLYEFLKERGILIRACGNYRGLTDRDYRVCVRSPRDNQQLLINILDYL